MTLVYRVEHDKLRIGPYNGPGRIQGMGPAHSSGCGRGSLSHPTPLEEGIFMVDADVCGFDSFQGMKHWFRGWLRRIHAGGHVLRVYEVPEKYIMRGERQLVFNRYKAKLVREQSVIGRELV